MTSSRFTYQADRTREAEGIVINMGSDDDPAGLKSLGQVINCAIWNQTGVDVVMDCTAPWPFEDNYADLVVFGDILEHLMLYEIHFALGEAKRVANKICITVPEDGRTIDPETGVVQWSWFNEGGRSHCTLVTEELLRDALEITGWKILDWQTVDYTFVPRGFFVYAIRDEAANLLSLPAETI